jgi:hypothetical protein
MNRDYVPGRYYDAEVIAGNKLIVWPNAPLWLFGYLQSAAFMVRVRSFSGRMKSDFMIAPSTVYFTFPFIVPGDDQGEGIEVSALYVPDVGAAHNQDSNSLEGTDEPSDSTVDSGGRMNAPHPTRTVERAIE